MDGSYGDIYIRRVTQERARLFSTRTNVSDTQRGGGSFAEGWGGGEKQRHLRGRKDPARIGSLLFCCEYTEEG